MTFGGKSKILTKKAGATTTVGDFFAHGSTSILVTSLHQTIRTYTAFPLRKFCFLAYSFPKISISEVR